MLLSAMSCIRAAMCFERITLAVEKTFSDGTLVGGVHNIFLARLFNKVNLMHFLSTKLVVLELMY